MNLIHGDCLEKMLDIPCGSVDMVLADPPYGTTACKWDSIIPLGPMWEQIKRIVKSNGAVCLFANEPFSSKMRFSNEKMYRYDWYIKKNYPSGVNFSKYQPMRVIETVLVFYKDTCKYFPIKRECSDSVKLKWKNGQIMDLESALKGSKDHGITNNYKRSVNYLVNPINFLEFKWDPRSKGYLHPTQKPVALMEYLIKTYTNENETVLDFCMGSGTTGEACLNLNRNFIGIEKDEKYFRLAEERLMKILNPEQLQLNI